VFYYVHPILVHNQCLYFELVSPVYFGDNVIWHIPPDQKVCANDVTKASFGKDAAKSEFTSVLIYKLQRKKHLESNDQSNEDSMFTKDTLTGFQLVVIWRYNSDRIYSHAWLIEHDNTFIWNEDKLERLYDVYNNQYNASSSMGGWLLDDDTVLKVGCETAYRSFGTKVVISEGKHVSSLIKPLWVDPDK
jgi:hypothetical protein